MKFIDLPTEITLVIADQLTESDVARLLRINKHMHSRLSDYLLKRNVRRHSMRALAWASRYGRRAVAQRLIQYGADINRRSRVQHDSLKDATLLHFATLTRRQPMVCLLLELGADPSLVDSEGRTAIYWAYLNKDEKAIRSISNKINDLHGFRVHRDHHLTLLHMACSAGLTTLIDEYIDMGMDISTKDHRGRSALDIARSCLMDLTTSSDSDCVIRWTRVLVMLGEDNATAHNLVRPLSSSFKLPRHIRLDRGNVRVGRGWCETSIVSSSDRNNDAAFEIPDIADFPSLTHTTDQAPSVSLTTQNIWSTAQLARSVVKHSQGSDAQPHETSLRTASDPFPFLSNRHKTPEVNEPSVTAWMTFREPSVQPNDVVKEDAPTLKQVKRRWQPLKW